VHFKTVQANKRIYLLANHRTYLDSGGPSTFSPEVVAPLVVVVMKLLNHKKYLGCTDSKN